MSRKRAGKTADRGSSAPRAKRSFGQNFLVHEPTIRKIAGFVEVPENRTIIELGVGRGALTRELARQAGPEGRVIGYELDRELLSWLREHGELAPNVEIRHADMLEISFQDLAEETGGPLVIAGNLPYNISSQVVIRLIDEKKWLKQAVFMFQKEVAMRLSAAPGSRQYGILSVLAGQCLEVRKLMDVSPGLFSPRPKVMSTVLEFVPLEQEIPVKDRALFRTVVKQAFSKRRKTIKNSLSQLFAAHPAGTVEEILRLAGIDPACRAETVSIKKFALLSDLALQLLAET